MGGYVCLATVTTGDLWRLGQLRPGDTVRFRKVSLKDARRLEEHVCRYVSSVASILSRIDQSGAETVRIEEWMPLHDDEIQSSPVMATIPSSFPPKSGIRRPKVVFRQAGDRYILIEYGEDEVDLEVRARIHLFEREVEKRKYEGEGKEREVLRGVMSLAPCVRSTMVGTVSYHAVCGGSSTSGVRDEGD